MIEDPAMIDVQAMRPAISHKGASKDERGWSGDKSSSVAINMCGSINGPAYVRTRDHPENRRQRLDGAIMLGVERARLPGRRFGVFVVEQDRGGFKPFLETGFTSMVKEEV